MNDIGFLIVRRVKNEKHSEYWKECYSSIRKFYPDKKIIIIDNNSDNNLIDLNFELINCEVIKSEIPESGFFAPFYYLLTKKFDFETGIILHDGMIFTDYIDFRDVKLCKFFWHFTSKCYQVNVNYFMNQLKNSDILLDVYNTNNWVGSLGGTGIFNISFLQKLEKNHEITRLKDRIKCSSDITDWERLIGIIMYANSKPFEYSYFDDCVTTAACNIPGVDNRGIYTQRIDWAYSYEQYLLDKSNNNLRKPFVKIFGRRLEF